MPLVVMNRHKWYRPEANQGHYSNLTQLNRILQRGQDRVCGSIRNQNGSLNLCVLEGYSSVESIWGADLSIMLHSTVSTLARFGSGESRWKQPQGWFSFNAVLSLLANLWYDIQHNCDFCISPPFAIGNSSLTTSFHPVLDDISL